MTERESAQNGENELLPESLEFELLAPEERIEEYEETEDDSSTETDKEFVNETEEHEIIVEKLEIDFEENEDS